jgi:ornithine--oxo-acid transaminase
MKSSLTALHSPEQTDLYEKYVNRQWVRLLDVLQMNVSYNRCTGSELQTIDGRRIIDFNSGYCVHNVGHNNPAITGRH